MGTLFENDQSLAALREDPLAERTRSHHRNLLLIATTAIVVAQLNLNPKHIAAIDVPLQPSDRHAIRVILFLGVVYFAVLFIASGLPDLVAWLEQRQARLAAISGVEFNIADFLRRLPELEAAADRDPGETTGGLANFNATKASLKTYRHHRSLYRRLWLATWLKFLIAFVVPIGVAAFALAELLGGPF